jgi:hypothetical protein
MFDHPMCMQHRNYHRSPSSFGPFSVVHLDTRDAFVVHILANTRQIDQVNQFRVSHYSSCIEMSCKDGEVFVAVRSRKASRKEL